MRTNYFAAILTLVLLATACGAGSGDGDPTSGGTLVTGGSRFVQTRDLSAGGGWETLLEYQVRYGLPVVHRESSTLYMARFNMSDPFQVYVHDLEPFDADGQATFTWPETGLADQVKGMSVSPDGDHVAGVLSMGNDTFLQVLSQGGEVPLSLLKGFDGVTGSDLVWLDDTVLLFAMDLRGVPLPDGEEFGGGIVAIDLADRMAGETGDEVPMGVVVGFTPEEWSEGTGGVTVNIDRVVHSLAVSADGSQLAYTYRDNVWLKDLRKLDSAPRQVTTGPFPQMGATFSPSGTSLAVVEYVETYESSVHLIPSTLAEPVLLDSDRPQGRRYLLDGVAARRILAWLP